MAANNYDGTIAEIEKSKDSEYAHKNMVLYYMDLGMVQHDAGKCADSDQSLNSAEQRMDELYTKSVHRAIGTFLINDNTTEYAGEPFEHAMLNVLRALNYLCLSQLDEAAVEARKVTFYLDHLRDARSASFAYRDDAFAQYLAALIFADTGRQDDARISMANAFKGYEAYAAHFDTKAPDFKDSSLQRNGEVVLFHYNGMAPAKVSKTFQIAWNNAVAVLRSSNDSEANGDRAKNALNAGLTGHAITVSYPEYEDMPYLVKSSAIEVDSVTTNTQLVENISAIARDELKNETAAQRTRMIVRATIKYIIAETASNQVKAQSEGLGLLTRIVTSSLASATEIADTRSWATLPAEIRMARIILPPGRHDLRINFKDAFGNIIASDMIKDVQVTRGKRTYLHYRTTR